LHVHSSYENNIKNQALKSDVQILETPNSIATLKYPRWVKLGTLFNATTNALKLTLLLQQEHEKETHKRK
jgi:hypothetical protein